MWEIDTLGLPQSFINEIVKSKDSVIIRSNLNSMEDINKWVKEYEKKTNTKWGVRTSFPAGSRILCSKKYICQHHSYRKVDEESRKKGVSKNINCDASIKFTVKKDTKDVRKKDKFVKKGLCGIIQINHAHSHSLETAEILRRLPADDCKKTFLQYFDEGMGVAESCKYHEEVLQSDEYFDSKQLSNSRINPIRSTVYYWYKEWKSTNLGLKAVKIKKKK